MKMNVENIKKEIECGQTILGIEFGSTRIKAVLINSKNEPIAQGGYDWENSLKDGIWTYSVEETFGCITFVLSWNIFKQKMGSGDLLIYLIIASYFSVTAASLALLVASFLAITVFIIEQNNKKQSFPFLPYIFIGLIFTQFLI